MSNINTNTAIIASLKNLNDVNPALAPTNAQVLSYDSGLGYWTAVTGGGGGGSGTVTSVAALTLGTTGTDLSSTVANGTTTPVITLQVPTASATNRGALASADWSTFNNKQAALVSATNIKTVSGVSLLGAGDLGIITGTYGGTGVNNGSSTITLAGNLVTSGANSLTLTTTGATTVTLPTSGTLVNDAVATLSSLTSIGTLGALAVTGTTTQTGALNLAGASSPVQVGGSAGTSGQVLTSAGAGATPTWSTAAGGATGYAYGGTVTTAPVANGEDSIVIGDAATATTFTDCVVMGRTSVASVNESIAIGYASRAAGSRSVAILIGDSATTYGAKAADTIAIGYRTRAEGTDSICIGRQASTQNGSESIAIGGGASATSTQSTAIGASATCTASSGVAIGYSTIAGRTGVAIGNFAQNSGQGNSIRIGCSGSADSFTIGGHTHITNGGFDNGGPCFYGIIPMWYQTSNATPTLLGGNNTTPGYGTTPTGRFPIDANSCHYIEGTILAMRTTGANVTSFSFKGVAYRATSAASTTWTLIGSLTQDTDNSSGLTTGSIAIAADTTNGGISITVTGIAATNIRWLAQLKTSSMRGTF